MGRVVSRDELLGTDFGDKKVVLDLLHIAHIRALSQYKALGDVLVVAILDDALITRTKGPGRPITAQNERAEVAAALSSVDYVYIISQERSEDRELLAKLKPAVYVVTGSLSEAPKYKELIDKLASISPDIKVEFVPEVIKAASRISTTDIIERIKDASRNQ